MRKTRKYKNKWETLKLARAPNVLFIFVPCCSRRYFRSVLLVCRNRGDGDVLILFSIARTKTADIEMRDYDGTGVQLLIITASFKSC